MAAMQSGEAPPGAPANIPQLAVARSPSWRVLAQPAFRTYFIGSVISNLGTWLQNTAQMLLAYQLTHSALTVGLITAAQFSGLLIIGPWAGHLANRMGRKRVLITTQIFSAGVAGALAVLQLGGHLTERELFCGALGTGLALTFALPVQNAMVSALAPQDSNAAMAMNSVSYNAGRTLAPVLYLVVLSSLGAGWAFAINSVSFLIFAGTIVAVYPRRAAPQRSLPRDWSGTRMALRQPKILVLLAMVAAVTFADDPVQVLGPSLARQVLGVSSLWPAYFLSALGLGTVLGSLLPVRPTNSRQVALSLGALAMFMMVFATGLNPWLSLAAAVMAGMAALLTGASAQAMLLSEAGRGRATQVMALWAVAWAGTKPIASLADGWLASTFNVRTAVVILAAPAIVVALLELAMRGKPRARIQELMRKHEARASS